MMNGGRGIARLWRNPGLAGVRLRRRGEKKDEERFLSSQADTFARANVKGKGVGLLRSK
jgi:hypothetical protein